MADLGLSTNAIYGLIGWFVLPNLVTGWLQTALYAIFIRAGDPKPIPGSPRFVRDRRRIQICVILAYLAYTIYDADFQLNREGDFYRDLGVPHDIDTRTLMSKARRLAGKYHSDKTSSNARSEAIYLHINKAKDTLSDPVKRFAYDRLGPEILQWQHKKTVHDHVLQGLTSYGGLYVLASTSALVLGYFGFLKGSIFWRFFVMAALFVIEAHAMTRPYFPVWLTHAINPILGATKLRAPYLPFQMLALLRKLSVAIFIGMAQLTPLLKDPKAAVASDGTIPPQVLDRLDATTQATSQEVDRMLGLELAPFANEDCEMRLLRGGIKHWLVQNTIRNDPELRAAMSRAFERRRQEGALDTHANQTH